LQVVANVCCIMNIFQHPLGLVACLYWMASASAVSLAMIPLWVWHSFLRQDDRTFQIMADGLARIYLHHLVSVMERHGAMKVKYYGDSLPLRESAFVSANHLSLTDWLIIFGLATRKGRAGCSRFFAKGSLRWVPGYGLALMLHGHLIMQRNWLKDERTIQQTFARIHRLQLPVWIVSFLEGTRMNANKLKHSQHYSREHNLPELKHVLVPRVKGFIATLSSLRTVLDAVYDITIGYENGRVPTLWELASCAANATVHVHVRRFVLADLPKDVAGLSKWCMELYVTKEALLEHFHKHGRFPGNELNEPLLFPDEQLSDPKTTSAKAKL